QTWLVGLDEFDETRHARALTVESPGLEAIRCDEDQRSLHHLVRAGCGKPGPGTSSISSAARTRAPSGTSAAMTGVLSCLRRRSRIGLSLRYWSPHCRSAFSAVNRSEPFCVRWYSYLAGRSW